MVWQRRSSAEEASAEDEGDHGGGGALQGGQGQEEGAGEALQKYQGDTTRYHQCNVMNNNECYVHFKAREPDRRCYLTYDKLIVDDNVYIFNDLEGRVERLPNKVR